MDGGTGRRMKRGQTHETIYSADNQHRTIYTALMMVYSVYPVHAVFGLHGAYYAVE